MPRSLILIMVLTLLVISAVVSHFADLRPYLEEHFLKLSFMSQVLSYLALVVMSSFIVLPLGILVKVLAGWLFGFKLGAVIAHLGLLGGSYLTFRFAKPLGRELAEGKLSTQFKRINQLADEQGVLGVVRLRLFPFLPMQAANYLLGFTKLTSFQFLIGSFVGTLPAVIFYTWIGDQIGGMDLKKIPPAYLQTFYLVCIVLLLMTFAYRKISRMPESLSSVMEFLRKSHQEAAAHAWDEQAVPSYLHPHPAVRLTFWKRITSSFILAPKGEVVLDYGCGLGAMLPWLVDGYTTVRVFDIDPRSLSKVQELSHSMNWNHVRPVSGSAGTLELASGSIDTIFALDVLEHVDELPKLLKEFERVLKPQGRLIISSPTENGVYKFMRRFGGPGYQGEYHLRAAKEVEHDLRQVFRVRLRRRIFPIFTFFRIVEASKK